jgi:hypothetical protein
MKKMLIVFAFMTFVIPAFSGVCEDQYLFDAQEHSTPFWGTVQVGTASYFDTNGCVVTVSCTKKYVCWINFNGIQDGTSETLCAN